MAAVRHHEYEERVRNAHIVFRSAQQHSIGAAAAAGKVPTYFGLVDEHLGPPGKKAKISPSFPPPLPAKLPIRRQVPLAKPPPAAQIRSCITREVGDAGRGEGQMNHGGSSSSSHPSNVPSSSLQGAVVLTPEQVAGNPVKEESGGGMRDTIGGGVQDPVGGGVRDAIGGGVRDAIGGGHDQGARTAALSSHSIASFHNANSAPRSPNSKRSTIIWKSFDEARKCVSQLGLKNTKQWLIWSKSGQRPFDIPSNPGKRYPEFKERGGMLYWCGYTPPSFLRVRRSQFIKPNCFKASRRQRHRSIAPVRKADTGVIVTKGGARPSAATRRRPRTAPADQVSIWHVVAVGAGVRRETPQRSHQGV